MGNSWNNGGDGGGDGLLNSNHQGTGRGKAASGNGFLGFPLASLDVKGLVILSENDCHFVTKVIFLSVLEKSFAKWDNSQNSTQKMRT